MYNHQRRRVTFDCGDEMITKQSHKDECDITRILSQYRRTGIITHVQSARATYTDLPSSIDYQESMNTLIKAEQAFDALPAIVRQHFGNDPATFLAAFQDDKQADKLREYGLLKAAEAVQPSSAPSPAPEPPKAS